MGARAHGRRHEGRRISRMLSAAPDVIGNATAQAGELRSLLAGEGRVGNPSQSTPEALRERSVAAERLEAAAVSQEVELTPWRRDAGVAMLTGQVGCIKGGRGARREMRRRERARRNDFKEVKDA